MEVLMGLLIAIVLFVFFSGVRVAFVSADKLRLEMERKNGLCARILSVFFNHSNEFVSTMWLGSIVTLVCCGILVAYAVNETMLYHTDVKDAVRMLIQIIVAVSVVLLISELFPKNVFKYHSNIVLRVCAFPLYVFYVILYPFAALTAGLSKLLLRLVGVKMNQDASAKALGRTDLDNFVQVGIENTDNQDELDTEVKFFQNALDFSNVKIRDCIVPRTEIVAVDVSTSLDDLKALFVESGLSKIIVYEGNIDKVVGYIHSSEMFHNPVDWRKNVKSVPIVPETMSAHKLMTLFTQQKKTLAVVVDEFGGTSGIVSLEDLVEEIFGEIEDEHDNTSYVCKQVGEHEYVLSARLEIEKVNETFGLDLPESDDYVTVGGLILNSYQSFPKLNEVVKIENFQFKIIKVTVTKIELVRLKVLE